MPGKRCFLVSADAAGSPHLAAAVVDEAEPGSLLVSGWFCPQTLANLEDNPRVCVVIVKGTEGYQLGGEVEEHSVAAILDGYSASEDDLPQAKFRLRIRVEKVMHLTDRPHSDENLEGATD
jgi:hypothetical protein